MWAPPRRETTRDHCPAARRQRARRGRSRFARDVGACHGIGTIDQWPMARVVADARPVRRDPRRCLCDQARRRAARSVAVPAHRRAVRQHGAATCADDSAHHSRLEDRQAAHDPGCHLRDGDHIVVCNARPAGERDNPWPRNLRVHPTAMVERGRERQTCNAREATRREIAGYWPDLVAMWPAYDRHYRATGDRSIFILDWSGWG